MLDLLLEVNMATMNWNGRNEKISVHVGNHAQFFGGCLVVPCQFLNICYLWM